MKKRKRKDLEIRFYENIVKERPNFVNVLISLGDIYTRKGFYEEGLAVDKRLAKLLPDDPIINYNLACSFSLVGNLDDALVQLKKAVLLGYDDFNFINEDSDLTSLRKTHKFKLFYSKLKKLQS